MLRVYLHKAQVEENVCVYFFVCLFMLLYDFPGPKLYISYLRDTI